MANEGIMATPEAMGVMPQNQPKLDPRVFPPKVFEDYAQNPEEFNSGVLEGIGQQDPALVQEFISTLDSMDVPPELIDILGKMVDAILAEPQRYEEIRAELIASGVPEDLLPQTFDAAFFGALNVALDRLSTKATSNAVQNFADGGIAMTPVAQALASKGRGADTRLAHIMPSERRLLRMYGGSGRINPNTGLAEFGIIKSIGKAFSSVAKGIGNAVGGLVSGIGKAVKKVVSSPLGRVALTALAVYAMGPAGLNFATGTLGITNAALAAGINTFAASTLVGVASGQKIKDALKTGVVSGLVAGVGTGLVGEGGFSAQVDPTTGLPVATPYQGATPVNDAGQTLAPGSSTTINGQNYIVSADGTQLVDPTGVSAPVPVSSVAGNATFPAPVTPSSPGQIPLDMEGGAVGIDGLSYDLPAPITTATPTPGLGTDFAPMSAPAPTGATGAFDVGGGAVPTAPTASTGGIGDVFDKYVEPGYNQYVKPYTPWGAEEAAQANAPTVAQQASDRYINAQITQNPDLTYDQIMARSTPQAAQIASNADKIWNSAYASASTPGMLQKYGATAAFGMAALGGGKQPEQPRPEDVTGGSTQTGFDLYAQDPAKYGVSLGGTYTARAPSQILLGAPTTTTSTTGSTQASGRMVWDPTLRKFVYVRPQQLASSGASTAMANGGPVYRADGSPATGEVLNPNAGTTTELGTTVPNIIVGGAQPLSSADYGYSPATGRQYVSPYTGVRTGISEANPAGILTLPSASYANRMPVAPASPTAINPFSFNLRYAGARPTPSPSMGIASQINNPQSFFSGMAQRFGRGARKYNDGGTAEYPRKNGHIEGPGTGTSDSIPAMLSDGEFVFTAKAVKGAGGGSRREGAKKMYALMKALERKKK